MAKKYIFFLSSFLVLSQAKAMEPHADEARQVSVRHTPATQEPILDPLQRELKTVTKLGVSLDQLVREVLVQISTTAGLANIEMLSFKMGQMKQVLRKIKEQRLKLLVLTTDMLQEFREKRHSSLEEEEFSPQRRAAAQMQQASFKMRETMEPIGQTARIAQALNIFIERALSKEPEAIFIKYLDLLAEKARMTEENQEMLKSEFNLLKFDS